LEFGRHIHIKDLVKHLRRDSYLRRVCGYGERSPSKAHFSKMKRCIEADGFRVIEKWLRYQALGLCAAQPLSVMSLV
jgi:hypothetical protein